MKLATTTGDFSRYELKNEHVLEILHSAGFRHIDFSFYNEAKTDSVFLSSEWEDYVGMLKNKAAELGLTYVQAHSPGGNPLNDPEGLLLASTIRSIEVCAMLGIQNTVVHAGYLPNIGKDEFFEKNLDFYKKLFPYMERNHVNVLIENSAKANMGENYYFMTGSDMREFIDYASHQYLFACWDIGHGNLQSDNQYEDIIALGNMLKAVHIQDNFGHMDDHIAPFMGTVNMDDIMRGLLDIDFAGYFTFEAENSLLFSNTWPNFRRPSHVEELLANPSLSLRIKMEAMLYEIGAEILKSYHCFEE